MLPIFVFSDSGGILDYINKNVGGRMKYMSLRVHFARHHMSETNSITLRHISGRANVADILTKPLGYEAYDRHRKTLGLMGSGHTEDKNSEHADFGEERSGFRGSRRTSAGGLSRNVSQAAIVNILGRTAESSLASFEGAVVKPAGGALNCVRMQKEETNGFALYVTIGFLGTMTVIISLMFGKVRALGRDIRTMLQEQ